MEVNKHFYKQNFAYFMFSEKLEFNFSIFLLFQVLELFLEI